MISTRDIEQAIGREIMLPPQMEAAISVWGKVYESNAPWLDKCIRPLGLAATICSKVSRVATIERQISVTGGPRADFLMSQFASLDSKLREYLEYALAKGGMMFKPYVSGSDILIDCVQADRFAPTQINGRGEITGAVFLTTVVRNNWYYTRVEHHIMSGDKCEITNAAYRSRVNTVLGTRISLASVPEWANLKDSEEISDLERPLFGYFKAPHANHIDLNSPLGESLFARALDLLREADFHWERYGWEFESAQRAIIAEESALDPANPRMERLLLRGNWEGKMGGGSFYEEFSPEIREAPFYAKLQAIFKRIEFNCGLAYGMLSDPQSKELTATEVISSKQDLYDTVEDIHHSLETALDGLFYGMDALAELYELSPSGEYRVAYDWGDSVLTDRDTERAIRMQEVSAGLTRPEEYRMWRYGEDEETARKNLPGMEEITEPEVE